MALTRPRPRPGWVEPTSKWATSSALEHGSSLEIGHLRHKVAASDFAGLFLPDALPYLWRRLPPLLESGTFGRDRFVLRARAHRQRTESGAPDHRRFSSTQSG